MTRKTAYRYYIFILKYIYIYIYLGRSVEERLRPSTHGLGVEGWNPNRTVSRPSLLPAVSVLCVYVCMYVCVCVCVCVYVYVCLHVLARMRLRAFVCVPVPRAHACVCARV